MSGNNKSSGMTFLLIVAALIIGAGGMYIYNQQNKESVSLELPGGDSITVTKEE